MRLQGLLPVGRDLNKRISMRTFLVVFVLGATSAYPQGRGWGGSRRCSSCQRPWLGAVNAAFVRENYTKCEYRVPDARREEVQVHVRLRSEGCVYGRENVSDDHAEDRVQRRAVWAG